MKALVAAILVIVPGVAAAEASPSIYLFDVVRRPGYRAAYTEMLRGESELPAWMATAEAVEGSTDMPGSVVRVAGEDREVFDACEPHNCGGHHLVVMFSGFGTEARGVLAIEGRTRFLGKPNAAERRALLATVPN